MDLDPGVRFLTVPRSVGPETARRKVLGLIFLIGCGLMACHSRASTAGPERCGPAVPEAAQHPVVRRAVTLAGQYDLIQVRTQPVAGIRSVGRLHLEPPDSLARAAAVGGAARDLVGWLETVEGDTAWRAGAGSRDPNRPGAVLTGDHLRLGQSGSPEAHVEHLTITAVAPDGFWGWWKADPGWEITTDSTTRRVLPDPAGYFCALRVRP
ncbi:MAG TPA: hypothetical protein VE399_01990 [Gemmatimonadales bacterium]|nr:hypothetical protein [Gemmatimonadales bacterium]